MTHVRWRIAVGAKTHVADDLAGTGAKVTGGRWNAMGHAIVHASSTRPLACHETVVHPNAGGLPLNRYLVEILVPDAVWFGARRQDREGLPVGWDAEPASRTSIDFGTAWLAGGASALLLVPSVIVPEELNILIDPGHKEAAGPSARKLRRWTYGPRLLKR